MQRDVSSRAIAALSAALVGLGLAGCGGAASGFSADLLAVTVLPAVPPVDLRADVNRSGLVELDQASEDEGEDTWDERHGAIFLPNLDDDLRTCSRAGNVSDTDLARCHDAADEVVNGPDDVTDLAPLVIAPWPDAPAGATARLEAAEPGRSRVRVFRRVGDGFEVVPLNAPLPRLVLLEGASLLLEGKDLARDAAGWDGFVDLTLVVEVPAQARWIPGVHRDTVRLRVAPALTFSHAQPVVRAFASNITGDADSAAFIAAVRGALGTVPLDTPAVDDQWTQDFMETGYFSMPAPNGAQKVITVFFRSANIDDPTSAAFPLRAAGRQVFTRYRGKDVAGVQQVAMDTSEEVQTLNSFGNFETIPPHSANGRVWPLGRVLRGSVEGYAPDRSFVALTAAQRWQQPSVDLDTSWLLVGHVDETVSFLKAATPRGWVVLANDARLAKAMLEAEVQRGHGNVPMFIGQAWLDDYGREHPAQVTIAQVLADPEVMASSAEAAVKVDEQLARLKAETGLTDAEIIKVPFLHEPAYGYSLAYQPGTVNLFVVDAHTVIVPDPHGPMIDGKDLFKAQLEAALAPHQVTVKWVDDWNLYHRLSGEVHCGTNALREVPSQKWWEVTP